MMKILFNAIALVALIGAAFLAPGPGVAPAAPAAPAAPGKIMAESAVGSVSRASAPVSTASIELRAQQLPVPVVRSAPARPTTAAPDQRSPSEATAPSPSSRDREAAKAAIEADGYKRVRIVDKGANGTWRAKAYRGATEVEVVVDGAGRVLTQ
jgi:hypothetical protein